MPHEQQWLDNETRIIDVTPMSMYKFLVAESMLYQAIKTMNISEETMMRRANIYAVKNTWRRYNLHYGRTL